MGSLVSIVPDMGSMSLPLILHDTLLISMPSASTSESESEPAESLGSVSVEQPEVARALQRRKARHRMKPVEGMMPPKKGG